MLAYAANRVNIAGRRSSPNAMLVIIGIHVAAVAVLMSAKMELPPIIKHPPIKIDLITEDDPPPPNPIDKPDPRQPNDQAVTRPDPVVPSPPLPGPMIDPAPVPFPNPEPWVSPSTDPQPRSDPRPAPTPVRLGPQLATPASQLKPPYPHSKLLTEEEAVLRLRLTIDERGRVVSVEPVGRADPIFLAAARRHLLAHWRYRPASEDGRAVGSSTVITLRFELDG